MFGKSKITLISKNFNAKFRMNTYVYKIELEDNIKKYATLKRFFKKIIKKDRENADKVSLKVESEEFDHQVFVGLLKIDDVNVKRILYAVEKLNSQKKVTLNELMITFNYFKWRK